MAGSEHGLDIGATETSTPSTETSSNTSQAPETKGTGEASTQTANSSQSAAFDWNGALPEEFSKALGGAKDYASIRDRFANKDREFQRVSQTAQELQRKLETYETVNKAMALNQPKPQLTPQEKYGFKDQNQFLAALQEDTFGAYEMLVDKILERKMEKIQEGVRPVIDKAINPIHQSAYEQRFKSNESAAIQAFPEIAEGGALRPVVDKYIADNPAVWESLLASSQRDPKVNAHMAIAQIALAPIFQERAKAGSTTQSAAQARAAAAKPGPGVKGNVNPADTKEALAAIASRTGGTQDMANAAAKMVERLGGKNKEKLHTGY